MKKTINGLLLTLFFAATAPAEFKVLVAGDSTVANNAPKCGWGDFIGVYFKSGTEVINLAKGGRSTKSFITEGRWNDLISCVQPGDVVFVQFGHNDQKINEEKGTNPETDYKDYLRKYADEVAGKSGRLIFITPPRRRTYRDDGTIKSDLQPYCDAMKAVAAEKNVPVVDLYTMTGEEMQRLGDDGTEFLFDTGDRSHFSKTGAEWLAKLIMDTVRAEKMLPPEFLK